MPGETSLSKLLASLVPTLTDDTFVFATLPPGTSPAPDIITACIMTFKEPEGLTLILPESIAIEHDVPHFYRSRQIVLDIHSSLEAVGFMAHISTRLATEGFSCNPVSAYYHDHLFVKADEAHAVMEALRSIQKTAEAAVPDSKRHAA